MKKIIFTIFLLFFVLSASAAISWMGNHTKAQPNNSQTIHFYVEMYNSYGGCHAEVKIYDGVSWVTHTLTQGANNGSNSTWSADVFVKSNSTAYYFHGWDDWSANVYDNNSGNNYSISINPTTAANSDWNTPSTWCDGSVPAASKNVVIAHNITLNAAATNNPTSITINASSGITFGASGAVTVAGTLTNGGSIVMTSGGTLTMASGSTLANGSATFTGGTGTVAFAGTGTVTGTIGFKNVTLAGGVDFGTSSTINGTLTINAGGYVNNNAPNYASGSTLIYNSGGNYGVSNEWKSNTTSGAGVPANVQIGNGVNDSSLTLGNNTYTLTGNLTFSNNTGAALAMNVSGGTLNIGGHWANNTTTSANFTKGGGAVVFNGSGAQSIGGSNTTAGGYAFNSLTVNNSSATSTGVTLSKPIDISGVLTLTAGVLNTDATNKLTISNTANTGISGGSSTSFIKGPITWTLPATPGTATYTFPLGKGTSYYPLAVINPTSSSLAFTLTGEAFAATTGGSAGTGLASISTSEYWSLASTGNFNGSTITATRPTAITPFNSLGRSASLTGAYTPLAGAAGTYSFTSSATSTGAAQFFVFGQLSTPTITTTGTLTSFGSVCTGANSSEQTFTVSGQFLTTDITVTPPAGFQISKTTGSGFVSNPSTLTLTQSSGTVSLTTIYVRFAPASATPYSANITATSTGATTQNVAAVGTGINTPPTVTTPTSTSVAATTATLGGNMTVVGCNNSTEQGIYYSTSTGFSDGVGTKVSTTGLNVSSTGVFTQAVTGLTAGTVYYYKAFTTSTSGTAYSVQETFTTLNDISTADFQSAATANWNTAASWQYNSTGSSWITATQVPGAGNNVNVQTGHTITLDVNATITGTKTITVNGTLVTGTNTVSGAGTFTLASAGTLKIGSLVGITSSGATGNVQTTTRNFNAAGNYTYNGVANQVTGNGLPLTITGTLTISNTGSNTVTLTTSGSTTTALSITGGIFVTGSGSTLNIASGGTVSVSGGSLASDATGGTVAFAGAGTVTGTIAFNNVTLAGGVAFSSASTINGTLTINAGGFVNTTAPTYSSGSTLIYNSGANYGIYTEWTAGATSGVGVPSNVQIGNGVNGSSLTLGNNTYTLTGNLTFSNNTGAALAMNVNGGTLNIGGNWANNTTTSANFTKGGGTVVFNGSGAQSIGGSNTTAGGYAFNSLTVNNSSGTSTGVTLSKPIDISGVLTLTAGVLNTDATNKLTISNTTTSGISGGSISTYIKGPLTWNLPASLGSGSTYIMPLGKTATYLPMSVVNPTTGTGAVTITGEAFAAGCGGTVSGVLASLSTTEYWSLASSGNFTGSSVSLSRPADISPLNAVGRSTTVTGTYASVACTVSAKGVTTTTASSGTAQFFAFATLGTPTITASSGVVASSPGSSTSGYVGNTVTINGTNLGNVTIVKVGGSGGTTVTILGKTATTLTFAAINLGGNIYVQDANGNATSTETYINLGYITAAATDWNTGSTWLGSAVPAASSTVTVAHAITINGTVTNNPTSVTVNSTKSLTFGSSGALTIASGGSITNNGTASLGGAGTVSFAGAGTVTGTIAFNNLTLAGAVVLSAATTVNGTLQLNSGGAVTANAPIYGASSTLIYNTTYNSNNEWTGGASTTVAAGYGIPANVQVLSGTVTLTGGRGVPGNVTVTAGGLTLNTSSGDLYIGGNLSNSGTWTNNGRAVVFVGTGTSTITASTGTQYFDYLLINKSSGSVQLTSTTNLTLNTNTGSVLQFLNAGTLDLNGKTLTFNNIGGNILADGATGGTTKSITSSTAGGIIAITNAKTASGTASGTLTIGTNISVVLTGSFNPGGVVTINGTLQMNAGGSVVTNSPKYGASSKLLYNSAATFARTLEWTAASGTIGTTAGYPNDVQISTTSTVLDYPNNSSNNTTNLALARDLTIDSETSLYMDYGAGTSSGCLTVGRNLSVLGSISLGDGPGGDLSVAGNFTNSGTFTHNNRGITLNGGSAQTIAGTLSSSGTSNCFYSLTTNNTLGGVTLATPVTVTNTLTLTNGIVTTSATNILAITNNAVGAISGGSSSSYVNGPLTWTLPDSGATDFKFQLGAGTTYLPFNINNPVGLTPVVTVQAFASDVNASATVTGNLASISHTEYWLASNTGTFTSGTISLAKAAIGTVNVVASSTAAAGAYASKGGTATSTLIASNTITAASTSGPLETSTYFVLGQLGTPAIASFTGSPGTTSSGYVGSTVTITGVYFTDATAVTVGGISVFSTVTVVNSTTITFTATSGLSGVIIVTTPIGVSFASSASYLDLGYITNATTDWNTGSTWLGNAVPPASSNVTVAHNITLDAATNNPTNVTINASSGITFGASGAITVSTLTNGGSVIMTSGGTLNIAATGTLTNNGTFTAGTGTVVFAGAGTIAGIGAIALNNLTIHGATTMTTAPSIGGILLVNNTNASIETHAVIYNSGSTLKFAASKTIGGSNQYWWTNTPSSGSAQQGIPWNVTVDASQTLTFDDNTPYYMNGNMLINGSLTLGGDGTTHWGDLYLRGNFTNNGTFTHNTRSVIFDGASAQTINGTLNGTTTTNCFAYLTINNASGGVSLSSPVTVTNTLTLTNGIVTTTGANILAITNNAVGAISGGNSSSYVNGPLRWTLPNGTGDFKFQVGTSTTYLPFNINNPVGTSPVVTVQAFASDVNAGAPVTGNLASISHTEYWLASNTGTFTSGTISLAKGTIGTVNALASSTASKGDFASKGGAVTSTLIASNTITAASTSGPLGTSTYFVLGTTPDIFSAKVAFKINSGTTTWNSANHDEACDPGNDGNFNTKDFGVVVRTGTTTLAIGGNLIANTAVTNAKLRYRMYSTSIADPSGIGYETVGLDTETLVCSGKTKKEQATPQTITASFFAADGDYYIEAYFEATNAVGTGVVYNNLNSNFKARISIYLPTPIAERDDNDGNYNPSETNSSGIYESYMGVLVEDELGAPISDLNRVFDMDGALSSSNGTNFDFGIQNPGLSFNVGTETKIFTKGLHKDCGCSSWYYVYGTTDPVAADFPLPTPGSLFTNQINGKFTLLNSSVSLGVNTPFTRTTSALIEKSTSTTSYNDLLGPIGEKTIKYKDYTDPTTGTVNTINNPETAVGCPTCSGTFKVAIAMLAWVSTNGNCADATSLIYHRDINKNKITDAGVVLNPNHPNVPTSNAGSPSKNTLPGTNLFYISKVTIGASGGTTEWDGTAWSNGDPTVKKNVTMGSNYSTASGSIICNDMTVNDDIVVTIINGTYIEALNTVDTKTTGKIIVENSGNFVQRCNEKPALAKIEHTKTTRPMSFLDYVYWGAPVLENVISQFPADFDWKFKWVSGGGTGSGWVDLTETKPAEGFVTRIRTSGSSVLVTFKGTASNGVITTPIKRENDIEDNYNNFALIANPYPCAIDAKTFLLNPNNTTIVSTLYFWTSITPIADIVYPGSAYTFNYNPEDYATWNLTGGTGTAAAGTDLTLTPTGKIASGQGFFVEAKNVGTATVTFDNSMRLIGDTNTQFFKTSQKNKKTLTNETTSLTLEEGRIWLNISNLGNFRQTLLGYMNGATNGYDGLFDAGSYSDSPILLYTMIDDKDLVIQGRQLPFDENEIVPIGYEASIEGDFYINIDQVDGFFNNQNVYLKDNLLGTEHDLKQDAYLFSTAVGKFNDRFELKFTSKTLGINNMEQKVDEVLISTSKNQLKVNSTSKEISSVTVYDIAGKKLLSKSNINNKEITLDKLTKQNQVLLVKVKLSNGQETTQKVIF